MSTSDEKSHSGRLTVLSEIRNEYLISAIAEVVITGMGHYWHGPRSDQY
jgi:hypothetical protein